MRSLRKMTRSTRQRCTRSRPLGDYFRRLSLGPCCMVLPVAILDASLLQASPTPPLVLCQVSLTNPDTHLCTWIEKATVIVRLSDHNTKTLDSLILSISRAPNLKSNVPTITSRCVHYCRPTNYFRLSCMLTSRNQTTLRKSKTCTQFKFNYM